MLKISQRDADIPYIRHQLNELIDSGDISWELKNFLCLNIMLHDPNERMEPEIRSMILETYNRLGESIKNEILDNMEGWLKRHTSGKYLFEWDQYSQDAEGTWAYSLVEDGGVESESGWNFSFIPEATKNLMKLAKQFYGNKLTKEDIESLHTTQDELTGSYDSATWKEYLSEEFREFIARKYTNAAFKSWKNFWGEELIKPTKDVTEAVNRLKNCSLQELAPAISLALNTYHVNGQMIEHTNLSKKDLDYLDNMSESEVEKLKKRIFGEEYSNLALSRTKMNILLSSRDRKYTEHTRRSFESSKELLEYGDHLTTDDWNWYAQNKPQLLIPAVINKFGKNSDFETRKNFDSDTWTYISDYNPEVIKRFADSLSKYDWQCILDKHPEYINKFGLYLTHIVWYYFSRMDEDFVDKIFTKEVINKFLDRFNEDIISSLAENHAELIPKEVLEKNHGNLSSNAWDKIAEKMPQYISEDLIEKYGKIFGRWTWNFLIKKNPNLLFKFFDKMDGNARSLIVYENPELFSDEVIEKYIDKLNHEDLMYLYKTHPSVKKLLTQRERMKENVTNVSTPRINTKNNENGGEQLYRMLIKRQELQYKYDHLKNYYQGKTIPAESDLPVLEFNLIAVNKVVMNYMYHIIYDWRKTRLEARQRRIVEMLQNEKLLTDLQNAIKSRNVEEQRLVIERALNTIHSSGQMIEHYGLKKYKLDFLSDMDTTQWDKEMEHIASVKISSRDIVSERLILGGFWISPDGEKHAVPWGEKSHGNWGREYLKNPNLSETEVYDALLSKNWVRTRADVIDFSEYALNTAKQFIYETVPEDKRNDEILVNIWPNGLIKRTTPNALLNADSVYEL